MVYTSCPLKKFGNISKVCKLPTMMSSLMSSLPIKMKILLILAKTLEKQKLNFSRSALLHIKTGVSLNIFYDWL